MRNCAVAFVVPFLLCCCLTGSAWAAPTETVSKMFTIPENAKVGDKIFIDLPWGGSHEVEVPEGKAGGDQITITLERPALSSNKEWLQEQRLTYFRTSLTRMYNEPALKVPEAKRSTAAIEKVVDKYWPDRTSQLWAGLAKKYPASTRAKMVAGQRPTPHDEWVAVPAAATGRAQVMLEPFVQKANWDKAFGHAMAGFKLMDDMKEAQKNRFKDAIAEFKAALEIDPYEHQSLAMLGWIFMTNAMKDDAVFFLRASLDVAPADLGNRFNLALLLKDMGVLDEAQTELQYIKRRMRPTHEKYKKVVQHLSECDAALNEMKDEI